jgi:hypothetical protein
MKKIIALGVVMAAIVGCAQITPEYKGDKLSKVSSFKTPLMGDLSFESEETTTNPKTGEVTVKRVKTSTSTNADKIIDAVTKQAGTLVDGGAKFIP